MKQLIRGLEVFHLHTVFQKFPMLAHLFRKSDFQLSPRYLMNLIQTDFKPNGSPREKNIYSYFVKYLREVAAKRRGEITLGHVLRFITGCSEVPELGFAVPLKMIFVDSTVTYKIIKKKSVREVESGTKLDEQGEKEVNEQTRETPLEKTKDEDKEENVEEKTDESTPEDENGEEIKVKVIDYTPKAHICANQIEMPRGSLDEELPPLENFLKIYDYAFANAFFGNY
ncbi:uncharacterized protein [Clytia hemisphaerica]|uniref:Uncharacterized protein n=1 Tax=Clytia hemisphaerica TaxID=252671 RepID=A0A7M5WSB9_9CNID